MKKYRYFTSRLLVPLKWFAPHVYTTVFRSIGGFNSNLDKLVGEASERIEALSQDSRRPIFIDCGANEGLVLKRFARRLPAFGMLGFEIQEELVSAAQKACPRAEIRNVAVADRNGQLEIYLPRNFSSDFRGGSSILKDYLSDSNIYDKRSVESLDFVELLNELKFVEGYDFIVVKMDIEGAEYQIIDALFEYFQRTGDSLIDFLLIEFHPKVLEKRSDNKLYIKKIADMGIKSVRWV